MEFLRLLLSTTAVASAYLTELAPVFHTRSICDCIMNAPPQKLQRYPSMKLPLSFQRYKAVVICHRKIALKNRGAWYYPIQLTLSRWTIVNSSLVPPSLGKAQELKLLIRRLVDDCSQFSS